MFLVPLLKVVFVYKSVYKCSVSEEGSDEGMVFFLTPIVKFSTVTICCSALLCVCYRTGEIACGLKEDHIVEYALDVAGVVAAGEQQPALIQEPVLAFNIPHVASAFNTTGSIAFVSCDSS